MSRILPVENKRGTFSPMRVYLAPTLPIPVNYATAAIPTYAPFGTDFTPEETMKIVGGRSISLPKLSSQNTLRRSLSMRDPAVQPSKPIQNLVTADGSKWQAQAKTRFDTTYRTEYLNRLNQPVNENYTKPTIHYKKVMNQYSVLPPIQPNNNQNFDRTENDDRSTINDQQVPNGDAMMALSLNDRPEENQYQDYQQPMMMPPVEDTYLPEQPVLLTEFEEQRLADQIRAQLGGAASIDRVKLLFQELANFDPSRTNFVHYSQIQTMIYQLGLNLNEDTLRFAMCKFVSMDQRGFVNYEELVRFIGRCLSTAQQSNVGERSSPKKQSRGSAHNDEVFDPDERQIRVLLKQNLKNFDLTGTIDFDRLTRELRFVDRTQSGVLNRQQIEEVIYKVRIPLQRSLIYQILEKHCRAYSKLYDWQKFVEYLREQIFDLKQIQDRSSPIYAQYVPTRSQWLDDLQREFHEKDRLRVIDRYISNAPGVRLEETHQQAWFTRFLRMANAMYTHRKNSNVSQEFVLPREETRRLFRAYNNIWDLKIDEHRADRIFDVCSRNGHVVVEEALKQLAK